MTSATDTDIQQLKDLITAGSAATQRQIADLAISTQKQIADLATSTQKQIADLAILNQKQVADLDKKIEVGFADMKGELKNIDTRLNNLESNSQKIPDLAEKVGELKNWKQIAIVIFTATVGVRSLRAARRSGGSSNRGKSNFPTVSPTVYFGKV